MYIFFSPSGTLKRRRCGHATFEFWHDIHSTANIAHANVLAVLRADHIFARLKEISRRILHMIRFCALIKCADEGLCHAFAKSRSVLLEHRRFPAAILVFADGLLYSCADQSKDPAN